MRTERVIVEYPPAEATRALQMFQAAIAGRTCVETVQETVTADRVTRAVSVTPCRQDGRWRRRIWQITLDGPHRVIWSGTADVLPAAGA